MRHHVTWSLAAIMGLLTCVANRTMAQDEFDIRWNVREGNWTVDDNWVDSTGSPAFQPDGSFEEGAFIGNGGTAIVDSAVTDVFNLSIPNGAVDIRQGGSLSSTGTGEFARPVSIGVQGELIMTGNGSLSTSTALTNSGLIWLGSTGATVDIGGNLTHSGTLRLDIGADGSTPKLTGGGAAALGGAIFANFDPAATLNFGDTFQFLSGASSVQNNGLAVTLPNNFPLATGLDVQVITNSNSASLTVGNLPVLTVNRATGQGSISNVVGGDLSMTAYDIRSSLGLLNPDGWSSLNSQGQADWRPANPRTVEIAELNLTGQTTLAVGESVSLGQVYNGGATHPNDEDVVFQFVAPDGRILDGIVEYEGPANDLVLNIDPETGNAVLNNSSAFIDPIDLAGYSVLSASGSLLPANFTPIGDPFVNSNPQVTALAELSLESSKLFSNGTSVNLGNIFADGGTRDVELQFATADALFIGTVVYEAFGGGGGPVPGDCNGDGVVNAGDLACVQTIADRDIVLGALNTLPGDLDGNGQVAFPDFLTLSNNFGQSVKDYTKGDIDLNGSIAFPDFLTLSNNFGKTPGATAAAVPEPATGLLGLLAVVGLLAAGRKRVSGRVLAACVVVCLGVAMPKNALHAEQILGVGTDALVGGDLTDPENDGDPEADVGYNAVFGANDEPGFGGGEFAFNVFDNIVGGGNDKWCCGVAGGFPPEGLWVEAALGLPYFLTSFTVSSANDTPGRDPTNWAIQGSNDGVNYDTIYEHAGSSFWTERNQVIRFSAGDDFPEQDTAYSVFRHVTYDSELNPDGAYFQFSELEFFGSLAAVIPGDFNDDGVVDQTDFGILADNFGTGTTFEQGDINRDFKVDLRDFVSFRDVFNGQGAAAAAVPEPSSLALLSVAGALLLGVRRRRR